MVNSSDRITPTNDPVMHGKRDGWLQHCGRVSPGGTSATMNVTMSTFSFQFPIYYSCAE